MVLLQGCLFPSFCIEKAQMGPRKERLAPEKGKPGGLIQLKNNKNIRRSPRGTRPVPQECVSDISESFINTWKRGLDI